MKQIGSVTTTWLEVPASEIGTQLGAPGSATSTGSRLVTWLAGRTPEEVDAAAVSQASRRNVDLRMRSEWRFPDGRPSYQVVVNCSAIGTDEDRAALLADVVKLLTPAPVREIEGWLAELSVIVARRPQEAMDEALRLTAYASRLSLYPADVARAALLDQRWQFWPTWDDLAAVCDAMVTKRRHIVAALRGSNEGEHPAARRLVPPEERERIHEMGARYLAEKAAEDARAQRAARVPHWSETAAPDDPRFAELRRARAASPISSPEGIV